jgi:uncharacterized protein (TIGR03546 family)
MVKAVAKLMVALNGNVKKSEIAAGIAWALLLGLLPAGNCFWVACFLASFFFRIHHGLKIAFMVLFGLLASAFAPQVDMLGWEVLHFDKLQPLFITMYNMPFVPFTKFNNTLVAGGLAAGLALWIPAFGLFLPAIALYRNTLAPKIKKSQFVQSLLKSPLVAALDKVFSAVSGG